MQAKRQAIQTLILFFSTSNIALLTELRAKLEQVFSHFVSDGTKYAALKSIKKIEHTG